MRGMRGSMRRVRVGHAGPVGACGQGALHSACDGLRASVQDALQADLAITISVGYASLSQGNFTTAEQMFEAADFALYSAKQAGRNRVMGFNERRSGDVGAREDTARV